jgi:hypothetical protein
MAEPSNAEAILAGSLGDPPVKVDLAFMNHLMQTNADMRLQLERLQDAHSNLIQMNQIGDPMRMLSILNGMSVQYAPHNGATQAICFAAEEAAIAVLQSITICYTNYNNIHKK